MTLTLGLESTPQELKSTETRGVKKKIIGRVEHPLPTPPANRTLCRSDVKATFATQQVADLAADYEALRDFVRRLNVLTSSENIHHT